MALRLRQKSLIMQNQNARERVRMALIEVASDISIEADPVNPTEEQAALATKRKKLAEAVLNYSTNWVDRFFPRLMNLQAVVSEGSNLTVDSGILTNNQETDVDDALVAGIASAWDSLVDSI